MRRLREGGHCAHCGKESLTGPYWETAPIGSLMSGSEIRCDACEQKHNAAEKAKEDDRWEALRHEQLRRHKQRQSRMTNQTSCGQEVNRIASEKLGIENLGATDFGKILRRALWDALTSGFELGEATAAPRPGTGQSSNQRTNKQQE